MGMTVVIGLVVSIVGLALTAWGFAMLTNYRQSATRYWESVYRWHERYNPLWRSPAASAARMVFLRTFGGIVACIVCLGWLFAGISIVAGWK